MSRYIRYKYQKQQINYLNCNDLDKWIDTCQTRLTGFDSICSGSCNCTTYGNDESEVIYSYKKLNPNYSYDCLDGNRYYKLQKQVSYDGGLTYVDLDEYETGDLYESNSPFCSAETVLMDWFESDNYCVGTDLYKREVKRVSFDGGNTWSDMGYTDENGVTTYEYRSSKIESNSCNCIVIGETLSFEFTEDTATYKLNETIYTATSSPYTVSLDDLGINELTNCKYTFMGTPITKLTSFPDTSNVTNMYMMFGNCRSLTTLDVSNFDTTNVTDMSGMFYQCNGLTSLNVSNFNTSNVKYMFAMFNNCRSLTTLDVSNFNTSGVTDISSMFDGCGSLTELNVSNFNTSNARTMNYMFSNCSGLTTLDVSNFNTSGVTNMGSMFYNCSGLTSLDVSNFDTSKVVDMSSMFNRCRSLTSLDLTNFNTSNVTKMNAMFDSCSGLTSLDLSNFNTSKVTIMSAMFYNCSGLTSLDLSSFDTSNVTNTSQMFYGCSGLTTLNVSNFNISNVTSMNNMFTNCNSLNRLILGEVTQEQYEWWCARLRKSGLSINIIEYTIISNAGGGSGSNE